MLTLHPRAVAGVPAEAAAPEDDEGRACYCVVAVAASVWLLLFVVLVAATASVAKACAVSGAAALLLGLAGCLVPSWGCLPAAARRQQQATAEPLRLVVHHHHHRCAACGLPDAAIAALPTFAYEPAPPAAKGGGGDKPRRSSSVLLCAVCLEDVRAGAVVRQLPACRHLFHVDCVDAWLRAHRTCPLCRCDLSPPNATAKAAAPAPANTAVTVESSPEALPPV